ncbi:MAG: hypothetical protein H6733_15325 [Alphaproteobacteria bacterium]|nr:hypothetical protein [Alphaproteobacteria bacterium]
MTMRYLAPLAMVVLASACKPPDDLVDDTTDTDTALSLADVFPLLFKDFEQGPDRLGELVDAMEAEIAAKGIDLDGALDQRSFTLAPLTHDGLDVTFPPGTNAEDQQPVVVLGRSSHTFADNLGTALEANQVCIESDSTVYYDRTYTSDLGCFEDASCDALTSTNEVRKELSILAAGWYDLFKDFKHAQTADGRDILAARSWTEEVFEGDGGGTFKQTFTAELWIENSAGTVDRVYAIWTEIEIALIGPDAMRSLITTSLDEGFQRADDFTSADGDDAAIEDYCREPRDRAYTRAEDTAE